MCRDTLRRCSENRMDAMNPLNRNAPAAGGAFITVAGSVIKVVAPRALHKIATGCCHVAQLSRRAVENRRREQRIFIAYQGMGRKAAVPYERANAHSAIRQLFNLRKR